MTVHSDIKSKRNQNQSFLFKVEEMFLDEGSRELYEDQYDSHGVLIRREGGEDEDLVGEAR